MRYRFVHLKVLGVPFLPQIRPPSGHSQCQGRSFELLWLGRSNSVWNLESRYFLGQKLCHLHNKWVFFPTQRISSHLHIYIYIYTYIYIYIYIWLGNREITNVTFQNIWASFIPIKPPNNHGKMPKKVRFRNDCTLPRRIHSYRHPHCETLEETDLLVERQISFFHRF